MRHKWSRVLLGMALIAALTGLGQAADVTNDEFKVLLDADAKTITKAAEAVEKATGAAKKTAEQRASHGIHSTALYVAAYSNARIGGKDDAKAAAIRDQALQIAKAAHAKDFKKVAELAKDLSSPKAAGKTEKIDVAKEAGVKEDDLDLVMHHFKKPTVYGSGAEDDIKAFSKKAPAKPEVAGAIAHRVLALAEFGKITVKGENAKQKKEWEEFNTKMAKAAEDLLKASQAKKVVPADIQKGFASINASCTACHNVFKGT